MVPYAKSSRLQVPSQPVGEESPCRVSPLIFIEFLLKLGKKLLNKWLALTMLRACNWPLVGTLRWRDIL